MYSGGVKRAYAMDHIPASKYSSDEILNKTFQSMMKKALMGDIGVWSLADFKGKISLGKSLLVLCGSKI